LPVQESIVTKKEPREFYYPRGSGDSIWHSEKSIIFGSLTTAVIGTRAGAGGGTPSDWKKAEA